MLDSIEHCVSALVNARHFEDAALEVLRCVLLLAESALAESLYARRGQLLRATLHLRPEGAYRRLFVLSREAARAERADVTGTGSGSPGDLVASLTAWRSVVEHRSAASIDVTLGTMETAGRAGSARSVEPTTFKSDESRQRFLGRQASHVHVLPLLAPGGAVEGMLSIEAECLAAVGQQFIWADCAKSLTLVTGIAAPYLLSLPPRPGAAAKPDALLPVVGSLLAAMVPILSIFAQQDETLLITGPTGAGKSRLARWCHAGSPRRAERFEILDLMTVPEDLQMAELFGWKRGAFTGAVKDSAGAVARAKGGTLFIDEIDKLSLKAQAGLLRFLEERVFRVLGEGGDGHRADVRFIVGTNADLEATVAAGRFREDLYYRINVLPIRVPPLSERIDEIPGWAHFMLERRHREKQPMGAVSVSAAARQRLVSTPWPGNLRQLDNIIRRAYTLALAENGGSVIDLVLDESHISQALTYETRFERATLTAALQAAAAKFVAEAQQRSGGIDLDLADAFRGFVLGMAIQRHGREEAFRIVGRESLVRGRNHHKTLRRALDQVEALLHVVGEMPSPFAALRDSDEP